MSVLKDILNCDGGNFLNARSNWNISDSPQTTIENASGGGDAAAKLTFGNLSGAILGNPSTRQFVFLAVRSPNGFLIDSNNSGSKTNYIQAKIKAVFPQSLSPFASNIWVSFDRFGSSQVNQIPFLNNITFTNEQGSFTNTDDTVNRRRNLNSFQASSFNGFNVLDDVLDQQIRGDRASFTIMSQNNTLAQFVNVLENLEIYIGDFKQTGVIDNLLLNANTQDEQNGQGNGFINLLPSGGIPAGSGGSYQYIWNDGAIVQNRSNLSAGVYPVEVRVAGIGLRRSRTFTLENQLPALPEVEADITNVTVNGGSDGAINLTPPPGTDYFYLWDTGETTEDLSGLEAGTYTVNITNNINGTQASFQFEVTEPVAGLVLPPFLDVPKIQSLEFTPQGRNLDFNRLDTYRHAEQKEFLNTYGRGFCYSQKFQQSDIITIQARAFSQSGAPINLKTFNKDGEELSIEPFTKVRTLAGIIENFTLRLQNGGSSGTRVYFQGLDQVPQGLDSGENIRVTNSINGDYDGIFEVQSINFDALTQQEYALITANWVSGNTNVSADGEIFTSDIEFDIWEKEINFATFNEGEYYFIVENPDIPEQTYKSEPVEIKTRHKNTNLFEFTNIDNGFNIDYTTGIVHRLRLETIIYNRKPTTEKISLRNSNGNLVTLNAKARRNIDVNFIMLPPYIYEKLAIAVSLDSFKINGVEFQTEEGLQEPEYIDRYGLASLTQSMEQKNWFDDQNETDLGSLQGEGGFVIANGGFIKR
jgi:hypothetical protein